MSLKFEPTNIDFVKRKYQARKDLLSELIDLLPKKPKWYAYGIYDTARQTLIHALRLGKPKEELFEYLNYMLQSGLGMFTMLANPGKPVSFQVGEVKVDTEGTTEVRDGNYLIWMSVLDIAIILRDGEAFKTLMEIPEAPLLEAFRPQGDDFNLKFFRYYRSLYHREINQGEALKELYEATDPKNLKVQPPEFVLNTWVPIMDVHFAILKQDQNEFKQKLEQAIFLRKAYVREQGKKEGYENRDTASFNEALVAAASLGAQRGLKMTLEADYLPRWMVEGVFPE